jgi:tetratricopeptide (TPR) repeat protein
MKYILTLLLTCSLLGLKAQVPSAESDLQFNSHFYDLENHWVVFPKNEKTGKYPFGFLYIDSYAGFTFNLEGSFSFKQGHIYRDSTDYLKSASYKYRLAPNTKPVYAISTEMLTVLGVPAEPTWLHIYKTDLSTVKGKVTWGKHYNSAGNIKKALEYLEDAYKTEPHAPGLEFELTYSYNELQEYDKAIAILNAALKNKPDDEMFYRELGYAYMKKKDTNAAIKTYLKGIEMMGQRNTDTKAEMAWNLAVIYRDQKDDADYKKWGQNAKDWVTENSTLGRQIKNIVL